MANTPDEDRHKQPGDAEPTPVERVPVLLEQAEERRKGHKTRDDRIGTPGPGLSWLNWSARWWPMEKTMMRDITEKVASFRICPNIRHSGRTAGT